jgi:hypothetical protein
MRIHTLFLGVAFVTLCGCATRDVSNPVPQSSTALNVARVQTAPDVPRCGGTNGVSISPCPLVLPKKTKGYAVFFVTGPGVINTYLNNDTEGFCYNKEGGEVCYLENLGSPPNYWQASSGTVCGKAKPVTFSAFGVNGLIGYAYLKVINKYCP